MKMRVTGHAPLSINNGYVPLYVFYGESKITCAYGQWACTIVTMCLMWYVPFQWLCWALQLIPL